MDTLLAMSASIPLRSPRRSPGLGPARAGYGRHVLATAPHPPAEAQTTEPAAPVVPIASATDGMSAIDASFRARQLRCLGCGGPLEADAAARSHTVLQCPRCAHARDDARPATSGAAVSLWATPADALAVRGRVARAASGP